MDKKLTAAKLKKTVERQTKIKTTTNPHLLHVAQSEAGILYEGVTDDAPVSDAADYRMISKSDDVTNSQGS